MFKKLHRQMTVFSALITSGILILMAVSCLVISERGLTRNSYERFLNNGNSCVAYLENQTILSHKWILEAKQEYGVELRILNNGKKLYFDKMNEKSENAEETPSEDFSDRDGKTFHGKKCWRRLPEFPGRNRGWMWNIQEAFPFQKRFIFRPQIFMHVPP